MKRLAAIPDAVLLTLLSSTATYAERKAALSAFAVAVYGKGYDDATADLAGVTLAKADLDTDANGYLVAPLVNRGTLDG